MNLNAELNQTIQALLPYLRECVAGQYGIALGGAHAKGIADQKSDLDLYVFAREILPNDRRSKVFKPIADLTPNTAHWGYTTEFVQAGSDFSYLGQRVECWFRNIDYVSDIVEECQAGIVKRTFVTWTVTGFYNHCTLSDLDKMAAVEDPQGVIARWKEQVRQYPGKLRENIIHEHLQAARFWPENFHYLSAIARGDIIYTTGIVQQVVHNLIQVIFALNRAYFPGDKKIGVALDHLTLKPTRCAERVKVLLFPAKESSQETLEAQRQELRRLLHDVETLVEQISD